MKDCINGPDYVAFECTGPAEDTSSWTFDTNAGFSTFACGENQFVGNYASGESITLTLTDTPAHQKVFVSWTLARVDRWYCDQNFIVYADGEKVYSRHFNSELANLCGDDYWYDGIFNLHTEFDHTGSTLTLEFTSGLNSTSDVHSWGICGVAISYVTDGTPTMTPTQETPTEETPTEEIPTETTTETPTEETPSETTTETPTEETPTEETPTEETPTEETPTETTPTEETPTETTTETPTEETPTEVTPTEETPTEETPTEETPTEETPTEETPTEATPTEETPTEETPTETTTETPTEETPTEETPTETTTETTTEEPTTTETTTESVPTTTTESPTSTATSTTTTTSTSSIGTQTSTYGYTVASYTTSGTSNEYNFTYMSNIVGPDITFYGKNASIYHHGPGYSAALGLNIYNGRATKFGFNFKSTSEQICAGFYQVDDMFTLNLGGSLLDNNAHVICSDGTYHGLGVYNGVVPTISLGTGATKAWTVSMDLLTLTFNITNANDEGFFGYIDNINNTYYLTTFKEAGFIKFTSSLTLTDKAYMKKLNPEKASKNYPFTWLAQHNDSSLHANTYSAMVQSWATGTHNMFGQSIADGKIVRYSWTFYPSEAYACVGLISSNDITSVSLTEDVRASSIALCSDNTKWNLTPGESGDTTVESGQAWTLSVDYMFNSVNFTKNGTTGVYYTASFDDVSSTYYTVQIGGYGGILFGGAVTNLIIS